MRPMGNICGAGITAEERAAIHASTKLDKELQGDSDGEERILKLLLLGTGESGKSTIFKQMQILHEDGFSEIEKSTFRHVVRTNVVESMQALIYGAKRFKIPLAPESEEATGKILALDPLAADFWTPNIKDWVSQLWLKDEGIQKVYDRRSEMQLLDSAKYLFNNIERIAPEDYNCTQDDILRARLRTSGIVERKFKIQGVDFKFLDVGGQRNERRKWIHCFENVTSVIFVTAISEFDQVLYEDEQVNRLQESLFVFSEMCNNTYFQETAMILFLNKIDLFEEKISKVSLKVCFDDYKGDNEFEDASAFITEKFKELADSSEKMIFCHLTCATDTENVDKVFEACKLVILKDNLEKLGLS